jgi:hypothetical protein
LIERGAGNFKLYPPIFLCAAYIHPGVQTGFIYNRKGGASAKHSAEGKLSLPQNIYVYEFYTLYIQKLVI